VSHGFEIKVQADVRVLTGFKQRDAESGRLLAYRLSVHDLGTTDNFGDQAKSCVVEECEVPTEESQTDDREKTQLTLAIRQVFADKAPGGTVLRFGEILDATKARCAFLAEKTADAAKKAVSRALQALERASVVQRCQIPRGSYRLTQETRQ
jgi:DNA-binding HxlR family transcriptional regulator